MVEQLKALLCELCKIVCGLKPGVAQRAIFVRRNEMATCTYRLPIVPSVSNFVEGVEFHAKINGAPAIVLTSNGVAFHPSNTTSIEYDFPVDASVEWFALWVGDNGTQAPSLTRIFTAINGAQVEAGRSGPAEFVRYNP
jgi:hypothetical protein